MYKYAIWYNIIVYIYSTICVWCFFFFLFHGIYRKRYITYYKYGDWCHMVPVYWWRVLFLQIPNGGTDFPDEKSTRICDWNNRNGVAIDMWEWLFAKAFLPTVRCAKYRKITHVWITFFDGISKFNRIFYLQRKMFHSVIGKFGKQCVQDA